MTYFAGRANVFLATTTGPSSGTAAGRPCEQRRFALAARRRNFYGRMSKGRTIGTFQWLVLSTSDPAASVAFYERAFDWHGIPMGARAGDTVMVKDGAPTAAVLDYRKNARIQKEPVNWLPLLRVENIEAAMERFVDLGGSVLVPLGSTGFAKVVVLRGVTGEAVGLWQTPETDGVDPMLLAPGVCGWFELVTREPDRAAAFYRAVFGWRIADEGGYRFISNDAGQFGGIVELAGDWEDHAFLAAIGSARGEKQKIPPHWMVFFAVDDCDAFTDEAEALGAQVTGRPETLHTLGTFAVLRDPQGVYFSVLSKR